MNTERDERRERMLEKVRKLLNMARDGRGNANEEETAMRQANNLMAEYGIAEAECDMAAIDAGELEYGEAQCGPDGQAPAQGKVYRSCPTWAGVLCIGVARFTDSVVVRKRTEHGEMFVFRGEKQDVLLARWIFSCLVKSIQSEQRSSGWTARGEANSFRLAAATALQNRLTGLARERRQMYAQARQQSQSRALVVVDRKAQEIALRFGTQKIRATSWGRGASSGAVQAGDSAGRRINIPSARPVGQSSHASLK